MREKNKIFITACEIVGSQAEMARILDVSPAMVNQMANGTRPVPDKYAYDIEKATGGAVSRKAICPNDWQRYWPEMSEVTHA